VNSEAQAAEVPFPFSRDDKPTGYITVNGEPMAYWLPVGVTAESINITAEIRGEQ